MCIEPQKGRDDVRSVHPPFRTFPPGCHQLSGEEALDYVRQRYQWVDGDDARMRHQQELIRAIFARAKQTGAIKQPAALLKAAGDAIRIYGDLDVMSLATQVKGLDPDQLVGVRAPTRKKWKKEWGGEEPVNPDWRSLWRALADGTLSEWTQTHPDWVNR